MMTTTFDPDDPPMKWLIQSLRDLAVDLLADPKTPWIGERDPKQHICWTAADRLQHFSERTAEASKADYDHGYAVGYEHGYEETDAPLREAVTSYLMFLRKSVNVGPLTKWPSKEAALLRRLMELVNMPAEKA